DVSLRDDQDALEQRLDLGVVVPLAGRRVRRGFGRHRQLLGRVDPSRCKWRAPSYGAGTGGGGLTGPATIVAASASPVSRSSTMRRPLCLASRPARSKTLVGRGKGPAMIT